MSAQLLTEEGGGRPAAGPNASPASSAELLCVLERLVGVQKLTAVEIDRVVSSLKAKSEVGESRALGPEQDDNEQSSGAGRRRVGGLAGHLTIGPDFFERGEAADEEIVSWIEP